MPFVSGLRGSGCCLLAVALLKRDGQNYSNRTRKWTLNRTGLPRGSGMLSIENVCFRAVCVRGLGAAAATAQECPIFAKQKVMIYSFPRPANIFFQFSRNLLLSWRTSIKQVQLTSISCSIIISGSRWAPLISPYTYLLETVASRAAILTPGKLNKTHTHTSHPSSFTRRSPAEKFIN